MKQERNLFFRIAKREHTVFILSLKSFKECTVKENSQVSKLDLFLEKFKTRSHDRYSDARTHHQGLEAPERFCSSRICYLLALIV